MSYVKGQKLQYRLNDGTVRIGYFDSEEVGVNFNKIWGYWEGKSHTSWVEAKLVSAVDSITEPQHLKEMIETHKPYIESDGFRAKVSKVQRLKGAEKYPELFNPDSWTDDELANHAMMEFHDGQEYVAGMRTRMQKLRETIRLLELEKAKVGMNGLTANIEQWATDRNLHTADPVKQMLKLFEEAGEIASGLARGNMDEVKDGLGDTVVVLTILAMQLGTSVEECTQIAYDEIKERKGRMVDGVFVKESDL